MSWLAGIDSANSVVHDYRPGMQGMLQGGTAGLDAINMQVQIDEMTHDGTSKVWSQA